MKAVDNLNYAPNFGARAIAANRTGIFGAVIPTMDNAIFARGIEAFQKALVERNATMLVASSDYDLKQEARQIRTLVGRGADGLLLIGFQRDPEIYRFLAERNITTVCAWNQTSDRSQSYVGFDNEAASYRLVQHAISLGHRTFVYISSPTHKNDRASGRLSGAKNAIRDFGLDPSNMPVTETEYSIGNGCDAFKRIFSAQGTNRPSLVICGNDVLAVGAIRGAKELGLRIPDEISIVGFDDIELATVVSPALTTVHVPHQDMGKKSAEALYALVSDPSVPVQVNLDTHIVERESLASPGS